METANAPAARPGRVPEVLSGVLLVAVLGLMIALGVLDVSARRLELRSLGRGEPAPAFSLPVPGAADTLALAAFQGKVVLVDFWATWCSPCRRELPELAALHQELAPQGFSVLAVNREPENVPGVVHYLHEHPLPFPVVVDTAGVGERYRILSMPTSVLVDREGRVLRQFAGYTAPEEIRAAVLAALAP